MNYDKVVAPTGPGGVYHRYIASETGVKQGHGDLSDDGGSVIYYLACFDMASRDDR